MKSLAFALCLIAAGPLLAFDTTPVKPRIGIVRVPGTHRYDPDEHVQKAVRESLRNELRGRGFDAFLSESTLEQIERSDDRRADLYVEIVGDADTEDYGGVNVGDRHVDVSIGVLVSHVAADIRIYDGRTLDVIATDSLSRRSTAVLPTSVGFGDHGLFAIIALPFLERAQVRSVARACAREMATRVIEVVDNE
ncbi:MAG: hypothetical protein ABI779_08840 [Acidobacteriota bacterium]